MNRGNSVIRKLAVLISLLVLANISYANEVSPAKTDKSTLQNTTRTESKAMPSTPLANAGSKTTAPPSLENHSEIGVSNYVQMLFGLFAIVVFIFAVAWLIKKMGTLNPNQSSHLKIIAGLSVGQREKIVVIQVMDEQLLVGITQSNIQLLSKLEQPIPVPSLNALGGFQEKLQSAISNFKKPTGTGGDA